MKCISIVSSPLQLLNFKEYINNFHINDYFLIILVYNQEEYNQFKKLVGFYKLNSNLIFKGKKILQYYKLYKLSKKYSYVDELIIGNFFTDPHLYLVNKINCRKLIVLDDGMSSTLIPEYIGTQKRILKSSFLRNCIFKIFSIDVSYPKYINLFTFFNNITSKKINVISNNLFFTKNLISDIELKDEVFLIGQPFVEINLIKKQDYFNYLKKLKRNFKNITYIPSRKELRNKIDEIENSLEYKILYPGINIELFFIIENFLPKKIFSFTSTSLILLDLIFNSKENLTDINSIILESTEKRFSSSIISSYYDTIKKCNLKMVKI